AAMASAPRRRAGALSGSIERLGGGRQRVAAIPILRARPRVVYVLADTIGGVFSIVANLLEHRRPDEFSYRAVLTRNRRDEGGRSNLPLAADTRTAVTYTLPDENMYAVVRRLEKAIGPGPGVLVCNDFVELLMASIVDPGKTVVQIFPGDAEQRRSRKDARAHSPRRPQLLLRPPPRARAARARVRRVQPRRVRHAAA